MDNAAQQRINNVRRIPSSLFISTLSNYTAGRNSNNENDGVGKKYGSYARYLAKRVRGNLTSNYQTVRETKQILPENCDCTNANQ